MEQTTTQFPFKKPSLKLSEAFVKRQLLFEFGKKSLNESIDSEISIKGTRVEMPFIIVDYEFPIYIEGVRHGFVDFIVEYRNRLYFLESKIGAGGFNVFWEASKVLAYTKVYNYFNDEQYQPAILLRYDQITENIQRAANILKLELFGVYWNEDKNRLIIKNVTKRRQ